ncbi:MAG: hypothetical protein Q8P45_01725 [Candidatus Harrisonbacteria bacterium]|nr:hypothetical protein [Candidatus Harrisonbacteria bacterium]
MRNNQGNVFLGLLAIIGVLLFAIWYIRSPYFVINRTEPLSSEEEAALIEAGEERIIEITSKGFVPEHLTISQYDTVTFINRDESLHQPESGEDLKDESCAEFGAARPLVLGERYSYVFTQSGLCPFHDALEKNLPSGLITVEALQ